MPMPLIAVVIGLLLTGLGLAGAVVGSSHGGKIVTALIPLYFGLIFVILGALSMIKPSLRKHAMHGLAVLALLGLLAAVGSGTARWSLMSTMAKTSISGMAVLCFVTLLLCVKSFGDARRSRQKLASNGTSDLA